MLQEAVNHCMSCESLCWMTHLRLPKLRKQGAAPAFYVAHQEFIPLENDIAWQKSTAPLQLAWSLGRLRFLRSELTETRIKRLLIWQAYEPLSRNTTEKFNASETHTKKLLK